MYACVKYSSWIGLEVGEGTDTTDVAANVGADLKFGAATCVSRMAVMLRKSEKCIVIKIILGKILKTEKLTLD